MYKIWLIIRREYLTRVRKRSFLLITLLMPVFLAGMIVVPVLIATKTTENQRIAVIDDSKLFINQLPDDKGIHFQFLENVSIDSFKHSYQEKGFTGLLYIPALELSRPNGITYYGKGQISMILEDNITKRLNEVLERKRMEQAGIDVKKLDEIKSDISLIVRSGKEEKQGSAALSYIIGYGSGFLIYIVLIVFGMMVMRGVMEEKMNRIAEVVISSVKPFQLMMGKIVGIAAVGLTQFFIWFLLLMALQMVLPLFISPEVLHIAGQMQAGNGAGMASNETALRIVEKMNFVINGVNWPLIIGCFLFYFLCGYLFYASLFAAVGSVVNEDPTDAQTLTLPITFPIIIGVFIMIAAVQNPGSPLAVWGSIIPFTSPIVMMARLPYGVPGTVPYWQLILSMLLLVGGFIFTTWLAGKIYRTGILLYGKKVTFRELGKWVFRKS